MEPRFQRKISKKKSEGCQRKLIDSGRSESNILKAKSQIEPAFNVLSEKIVNDTKKIIRLKSKAFRKNKTPTKIILTSQESVKI